MIGATKLILSFGAGLTGHAATTEYRLREPGGTLVQDWTNTGIAESDILGQYEVAYTFSAEGTFILDGKLVVGAATYYTDSEEFDVEVSAADALTAYGAATATEVGTPLQAADYVAPDNATIEAAISALGTPLQAGDLASVAADVAMEGRDTIHDVLDEPGLKCLRIFVLAA
jgi:hypothetical protein